MKLQLDSSALEALFPEGTEARLDLQQAVLQNIVDRNFIKMSDKKIDEAIKQAVTELELPNLADDVDTKLRAMLAQRGYGNHTASQALKEHVKVAAAAEATSVLDKVVSDGVQQAEKVLARRAESIVQSTQARMEVLVSSKLQEAFAKVLNEQFEEFITAAIRQRLGV
ncbi:hypothetical protein [Cronobacter phage vB_Cdu_VP8]|nr:hypothetical protein [Cronobacter phage vB_Cdu_VP8]